MHEAMTRYHVIVLRQSEGDVRRPRFDRSRHLKQHRVAAGVLPRQQEVARCRVAPVGTLKAAFGLTASADIDVQSAACVDEHENGYHTQPQTDVRTTHLLLGC